MLTDEMIARKIVLDQNNGFSLCPRCGGRMPDPVTHGALSRHASGVYICEMCGMDEALRDWKGNALPLSSWKLVRSRAIFPALIKLEHDLLKIIKKLIKALYRCSKKLRYIAILFD